MKHVLKFIVAAALLPLAALHAATLTLVAQATYHVPGDEALPDIRSAQAALWQDGSALEGPDTDQFKGELREPMLCP